ncbi:DUF222 domain-containing protein [Granulicoccus sp. GXG6511]|uniref:HNH endonuclease signature motif containing protein n=1 Tax=Granulicoccus sp. GXG6511 TaxID=3381351 RepID=UPI003D7F11D6
METECGAGVCPLTGVDSGGVLVMLETAIDRFACLEREDVTAEERVSLASAAVLLAQRARVVAAVLASEAESAEAAVEAKGTPLASLLAQDRRVTTKEVAGLVFAGGDVLAHEPLRQAVLAGNVGIGQARSIAGVMRQLPGGMTSEEIDLVLAALLERAELDNAHKLARSRDAVLKEVVPEVYEAIDKEAEAAQRRQRAVQRRSLAFHSTGDGTTIIKGRLPDAEAAAFQKHIKAEVEADRRAGRDLPDGDYRTFGQRMADGLMAWVRRGRRAGSLAGDRPRVVVLMSFDKLRELLEQNGVLDSGEEISPGELRRMCCDADLMPIVLGADSEPLDVGMTQRLVPSAIRRTLSARDRGCIFPACDVSDDRCEAHHIVPWWASGPTALENLVLLCPHHHALVEPQRFWAEPTRSRWEVRLGADMVPEVIPPDRVDPSRTPMRHERFG